MLWLTITCIFTSSVASFTITIPQEVDLDRLVEVGWKRTPKEPAEFFFQLRTVEGAVGPPIEIGRPPEQPPPTSSVPNPEPTPPPLQGWVLAVFRDAGSFILVTVDSITFKVLGSSTIFQVHRTPSRPGVGPDLTAIDIVTFTATTPVRSQSNSQVSFSLQSSPSVTLESHTKDPSGSAHHDPSSATRNSTTNTPSQPSRTVPTPSSNTTSRTSTSSSNMVPSPPTPSSTETPTTPTNDSSSTQRQSLNIAMIVGLVIGGVVLVVLLRWLFAWLWRRSTYAAAHSTPFRAMQYYIARTFALFHRHLSDPSPPNSARAGTHPAYTESKERLYAGDPSNTALDSSPSTLAPVDARDPDPIRHRIAELEQANVQQSTEMAQLMVENEVWRGQHLRASDLQEHPPPHYDGTGASTAGGSEATQGPGNPPG